MATKTYRFEVLKLAYEIPMAGHLGVNKTYDDIMKHFYWPGIRSVVSTFCKKACDTFGFAVYPKCWGEAFTRALSNCIGPNLGLEISIC